MKKIVVKVPKINILKETPEERKARVQQAGSSMRSRVVPNKKKPSETKRQKRESERQADNKRIREYV